MYLYNFYADLGSLNAAKCESLNGKQVDLGHCNTFKDLHASLVGSEGRYCDGGGSVLHHSPSSELKEGVEETA